jgi:hypothetical protein
VRSVIFRFYNLSALGKFGIHIARGPDFFTRLTRRILQFLLELSGRVSRVTAILPLDLQVLAPFERRPGIVRDNGDSAQRLKSVGRSEGINWNCLLNALDL